MTRTHQHLRSVIYGAWLLFASAGAPRAENPVADSAPQPTEATPTPSPQPLTPEMEAEEMEAQIKAQPDNIELRKALGILYLEKLHDPAKALPLLEAVVAAQPEDADWLVILARAQGEAGQKETAVETFRKSAAIDLRSAWLRRELAATLSGLGRHREAEEALREAVALDGSSYLRIELAKTLYAQGKREDATEVAEAVLREEPGNAAAADLLAKVKGVKPTYSGEDTMKQVQQLEEQISADPDNVELRGALGILYLEKLNNPAKALPNLEAVVAAKPEDANWLQTLARAQRGARQKEAAVETFRKSAAIDLRNAWLRRELAATLTELGRHREAEEAMREAVALDGSSYLRIELAKTLYAQGRREDATEVAEAVLREEPGNAAAADLLAKIKGVKPTYSGEDSMKQVQQLEEQISADPGNVELRGALGILYLEKLNNPVKALPNLEAVVAAKSEDANWLQTLARAQRAAGKPERAVETYRKCLSLDPQNVWLRNDLAATLSSLGRYREAEQTLREAIEIDDSNPYFRVALARALYSQGKREDAEKAVREVLRKDPDNREAKDLLAKIRVRVPSPLERLVAAAYASKENALFLQAARAIEDHLRSNPEDLKNRKTLGFIYLEKLKDPRSAIPHLEMVVKSSSTDTDWLQILARAYEGAGQREAAADAYRQAAVRNPRDVWARYHLARMLKDLKRPKEAQEALAQALAIDPDNNQVRLEIAQLAHAGGHDASAARLVDEILRSEPANAGAHVLRGDIYRADWNFPRARAEYEAVSNSDPYFSSAQAGLTAMKKLQKHDFALIFYTFNDTDDFRQSGIFSNLTLFSTGPLRLSATVNELFFDQPPAPDISRLEVGFGLDYRFNRWLQVSGGASFFKTQSFDPKSGGNVTINLTPARALDLWFSYRYAAPVNFSYTTVAEAFTQNIISGGFYLHPVRSVLVSFTASNGEFSDGNNRHFVLATIAYYAPLWASPVLKLEYEWLDYAYQTFKYSSPQNYALLRPVLELTPQITKWLSVNFRGELPYVFDEGKWGTGLAVGPRITFSDWLNISVQYLNYQIPGGQSTWSGSGFKAQVSGRF